MAPDGSNQRSIAPSVTVLPNAPLWSPDGQRLAFVAVESEQEVIYTVRADGLGLTKIPWPDGLDADLVVNRRIPSGRERILPVVPRWSPDGERIVFVAYRQEESDAVLVASADGSEAREISNVADVIEPGQISSSGGPIQVHNVAWSLDGSEIGIEAGHYGYSYPKERNFYTEDRSIRPVASAFMVGADGSNLRLVADPGNTIDFPEWAAGLVETGPWRLRISSVRTESLTNPSGAGDTSWKLSAISWNGYEVKVLARTNGARWLAGNPSQGAGSEESGRCSRRRVGGNPLTNGGLVRDCRTLLKIRDTLAGDAILYWSADVPVREWLGITVAGRPPRVTELYSVPTVTLSGSISPEIGKLDRLQTLVLADNELTGVLPPEIANLRHLEVLDLGSSRLVHNNITGDIPPELGNLSSLRVLDLSRNSFSGPIPPELGKLTNLEELNLYKNPLQSAIPPELGKLNNLRLLYLGGNRNQQLTGNVPPELGNLAHLEELIIHGPGLTGPIPPELGSLSQLKKLHLRGNGQNVVGLTGTIPPELGNLKNLNELMLDNNRLEGEIPQEIGDLIPDQGGYRLFYVYLNGNRFTGCAPAKLQKVSFIRVDVPFCN